MPVAAAVLVRLADDPVAGVDRLLHLRRRVGRRDRVQAVGRHRRVVARRRGGRRRSCRSVAVAALHLRAQDLCVAAAEDAVDLQVVGLLEAAQRPARVAPEDAVDVGREAQLAEPGLQDADIVSL